MNYIIILTVALAFYFLWKSKKTKPRATPTAPTISSANISQQPTQIEENDSWEGSFFDGASNPKPVNARVKIKYTDSNNLTTLRSIVVKEFDSTPRSDGLILAFCELRKANRSFRYDRIKECIDLETGEVITDVQGYLCKKYEQSPEHSLDEFYEEYSSLLECLIFIARADGAFRKTEKDIVLDFCRKHMPDTRVKEKDILDIFKRTEKISIAKYRRIVTRILNMDNKIIEDLIITASNMIAADKKIHPAEKEAFDYLKKRALKNEA